MLSIFSCAYGPLMYLLWRNIYSDLFPLFKLFVLLICKSFYVMNTSPLSGMWFAYAVDPQTAWGLGTPPLTSTASCRAVENPRVTFSSPKLTLSLAIYRRLGALVPGPPVDTKVCGCSVPYIKWHRSVPMVTLPPNTHTHGHTHVWTPSHVNQI